MGKPILYNARGSVITSKDRQSMGFKAGLYPSPYSYNNYGNFRVRSNSIQDTEQTVNMADRLQLVSLSRTLFAQMACVSAASEQKAEWTIGNCFEPVYLGKNSQWGKTVCEWLLNDWYPNSNVKGFAYDFKTSFKIISQLLDADGDVLMLLIQTRTGMPLLQFVPTHRIGQRENESEIKTGRYAGLKILDGVIYSKLGSPVAYYIKGDKSEDDYIASVKDAYLIFSPKHMDKGRGLPAIASAILTGLSIQEIDDYLQTTIKIESLIHLKEKNEQGEAPAHRTSIADIDEDEINVAPPSTIDPPSVETMYGGIRYIKYGAGDVESFVSNRPGTETQEFVRRLEVHLLSALGWPHQVMYSPNDVGGAAARGISEIVRRTISSRQTLLEKYGKVALAFAVGTAINSGILPENNEEPWLKLFTFTKPAQFTLDSGYERQSDLADYRIGAKSLDEITTKYGKRLSEVRQQINSEVEQKYVDADRIQKKLAQQGITVTQTQILNDLQMKGANPLSEPPVETTSTEATTKGQKK
jgi:hypothetical protein